MGQEYMKMFILNLRLPTFFPECFYPGLYSLGNKLEEKKKKVSCDSNRPMKKRSKYIDIEGSPNDMAQAHRRPVCDGRIWSHGT